MTLFSIFIPLYIYPLWFIGGTEWYQLADLMARHPRVEYVLFINPDSGPPETENTDFTAGFAILKAQGNASHIKILGYVPTEFGSLSLSTVTRDIDLYYQFWPNDINGILVDQMHNIAGFETYYQAITDHVHNKRPNQLVVANPGTSTLAAYVATADVLQVLESTGNPTLATVITDTFNGQFSRNKFALGIHSEPSFNAPLLTQFAAHAKYIFTTSDVLANPYDTLSIYLENMSSLIDRIPLSSRSAAELTNNNNVGVLMNRNKF